MTANQSNKTIFYSWQSDLKNRTNRSFIQDALQKAIDAICETELEIDLILDRDTQNVPGAPDVAQTILSKIDQAFVVVADVSIINANGQGRPCPNPNVLFELGYAVRTLSWDRVLPVFNLATGRIEELPFDLRQRRPIIYTMTEQVEDKAPEIKKLARSLQAALQLILKSHNEKLSQKPHLSLDAKATKSYRKEILLGVKNDGSNQAKAPYLSFTIPSNYRLSPCGIDGNYTEGFLGPANPSGNYRKLQFGGRSDVAIPAHTTLWAAAIIYNGHIDSVATGDILIEYELSAEDIPKFSSSIRIDTEGTVS